MEAWAGWSEDAVQRLRITYVILVHVPLDEKTPFI